ncbi:hypothetical protein CHCC14437_4428 [Bacillus licheniformis]|nr:hypothetical protein CHCC14437_4428 [Bacillus licheniformis]
MDAIKDAGYQLITPVIITNTDRYQSIKPLKSDESVDIEEALIALA